MGPGWARFIAIVATASGAKRPTAACFFYFSKEAFWKLGEAFLKTKQIKTSDLHYLDVFGSL